ncbi:MAG: hypothetical protein IPF68_08620 [Bacteroidales bacterium]|nr:hypothetical protein [Bacteroidales bacterium]
MAFLAKHHRVPENIRFELHDNLAGDALTGFLETKTHLLFAMGTSLLEGCKAGVPAIITDPAYQLSDHTLYRFVAGEKGYCLGLPAWVYTNTEGSSLQETFDHLLLENGQYHQFCVKAYEYVITNHNVDAWIDRFVALSSNSKVRIKDLAFSLKYFKRRRVLYRIFAQIVNSF